MSTSRLRARSNQTNTLFGVDLSRGIYSAVGQAKDLIGGIIDPSKKRLSNAGLNPGAQRASGKISQAQFANQDWRVRLSLAPGNGYFYNDDSNSVLQPLKQTGGLIWPYTPQVMLSHSASYASSQPTHSNYPQHFYGSSSVDQITVTGEFTAQNALEASYVVAAITFLRSVTKMFYGSRDQIAGTPPPVLRLNGYGDHIFNNVPVVVTTFTSDFGADVDYINAQVQTRTSGEPTTRFVSDAEDPDGGYYVTESGGSGTTTRPTRVPTRTSISVGLLPLYSRQQMKDFGLQDYSAGRLIKSSNPLTGKGGFI